MGLRNICTTQETSRKLKEAGFPQEGGIYYWTKQDKGWFIVESSCMDVSDIIGKDTPKYRAFTFNELWEILPERILCIENNKHCCFVIEMDRYSIAYIDKVKREVLMRINKYNPITQEAAAELLLWAKREGYLKEEGKNEQG